MRGWILGVLLAVLSAVVQPVEAGTYTVTVADDAQLKALADAQKKTSQAVLQGLVDNFLTGRKQADLARKLAETQRACRQGDQAACGAIEQAAKAAPATPARGRPRP